MSIKNTSPKLNYVTLSEETKRLLPGVQRTFEYINQGGDMIGRMRGIFPITSPEGHAIGIRLGDDLPKPGKKAITFVVGTHPNEIGAFYIAQKLIEQWKAPGGIPHDLPFDINIVIGGPVDRIEEFFGYIRSTPKPTVEGIINYRTDHRGNNWNRIPKTPGNPAYEHYKMLNKTVYAKSQIVAGLHTMSLPGLNTLYFNINDGVDKEVALDGYGAIRNPTHNLPVIMHDMINSLPADFINMDGNMTGKPGEPLRATIEIAGPHWDHTQWETGTKAVIEFINKVIGPNQHNRKWIKKHPLSVDLSPKQFISITSQNPEAGIYQNPVGIYHPGQAVSDEAAQYQSIAKEQEVDWNRACRDTYLLIQGPQFFDIATPLAQNRLVEFMQQAGQDPSNIRQGREGNFRFIEKGQPVMVGQNTGLVIPAPKSGYIFKTPLTPEVRPDQLEEAIVVMDCPLREHRSRSSHVERLRSAAPSQSSSMAMS